MCLHWKHTILFVKEPRHLDKQSLILILLANRLMYFKTICQGAIVTHSVVRLSLLHNITNEEHYEECL